SRDRGVAGRAFIGQIYSSAIYTSSTGLMIIKRIRHQSLAPLYRASCGALFLPRRSAKCSTVRPESSAMPISRRQLIATAGRSVLAGVSPACRGVARLVPAGGEVEAPAGWDAVRRQFNLSPDYTHLSQFFIVSHPRPVREAIERYRRAIDDNPFLVVERGMFDAEDNLPLHV